ncbi:MAG: YIP1 family protein [Nitrososphaerota archaeon]
MELLNLLKNPIEFFENIKDKNWKHAFKFFLIITIILSIITSIVNFLGIESTDLSSAYQAQILAYRILKYTLLHQYEKFVYLIEAFLIFIFSIIILLISTIFLHLVFKFMGGKGSILNAWKALCYGGWTMYNWWIFAIYITICSLLFTYFTILHRTKNFILSQRIKSNNFFSYYTCFNFY